VAARIAALPYDVYDREEARAEVAREPLSFLKIDRAETQFPEDVSPYDPKVYEKARDTLKEMMAEGLFVQDSDRHFYVYELIMNGRAQTGLVGCLAIDDYLNDVIKKHEKTREDKELDRINHIDVCNAQTGPIFVAYRARKTVDDIVAGAKAQQPLYDFIAPDGVRHVAWRIDNPSDIAALVAEFRDVPCVYIADGHHRAASAVKVGLKRRRERPHYTGEEEFNYFLAVLFPHDQLMIMDYNRVVKDLNGYTRDEFLAKVKESFVIEAMGEHPFKPQVKGTFGMYLEGTWYKLTAKEEIRSDDPVAGLDVSVLQDHLLAPVLGIKDPRTDHRIDFVGGIRGLKELERRVRQDMKVAFALAPTSIAELFAVADAGQLMPPKSTWFEPKLRSGLFIHSLE